MKLRINGNSLRLRVTRSELDELVDAGRVEETIHFSAGERSRLTYALECRPDAAEIAVRFDLPKVAVVLPAELAAAWRAGDETGLYAAVDIGAHGSLEVAVEKDFACLHRDEPDSADRFPNPNAVAAV